MTRRRRSFILPPAMVNDEAAFLSALTRIKRLPAVELKKLLEGFGSAQSIWRMPGGEMLAAGIKPATARMLAQERRLIDPSKEALLIYKEGLSVLAVGGPDYPPQLEQLPDAPPVIFVRGSVSALKEARMLAVVGTRRLTAYGESTAKMICRPLASSGVVIVSGLALGIDAVAHASALDTRARTVAVLGSGVDRASVGPRSNSGLAERIVALGGALISEYPPGTEGKKHHFPLRNRIIAGLSRGVLVVEAAERSGALITAAAALEYNRDVFAIPGPITYPTAAGVNSLIGQGAVPVTSAATVLDHYGWPAAIAGKLPEIDPDQRTVCRALDDGGPLSIEDLSARTSLGFSDIVTALTGLEIIGIVEKIGNRWTARFDSARQRRLL